VAAAGWVQPPRMGAYSQYLRPRLHAFALKEKLTGEVRARVCAGLSGDVLEIGIGSALNQPHLPPAVTGVWAVEPSETAIRLGAEHRAASAIPVVVAGDDARSLPFPDDRFDAALCTWVLCGIPDPGRALAEIARVLRPGGALHFVEHGLAPDPGTVAWQRRGNRINRAIAGCVLDNDVASLLEASPLAVTQLTTFYEKGAPKPAGYMYEGRAVA
jgi:SAM-dependent methyltransferase